STGSEAGTGRGLSGKGMDRTPGLIARGQRIERECGPAVRASHQFRPGEKQPLRRRVGSDRLPIGVAEIPVVDLAPKVRAGSLQRSRLIQDQERPFAEVVEKGV